MSDLNDDPDDEDETDRKRPVVGGRMLSNGQVIAFVWRQWMRRPGTFALVIVFIIASTACDLAIPWAAGELINAVTGQGAAKAAWIGWAWLSGLYAVGYMTRLASWRIMNPFAARNMEEVVNAAFQRVQSFSSDWHADTFAGATVRRVSRAMQGYDAASDAIILMLGPTLLVLAGLAVSMGVRWPLAGLFTGLVVAGFVAFNIAASVRYIRPANLRSIALDSKIGASLADAIGGNTAVKSFGAEGREEQRFAAITATWRAATIRTWNRFNVVAFGQNILMLALQAGMTGILIYAWSKGQAKPGDVAFAITSFMLMSGYMRNFGEITRMLQRGLDDTMDVAAYMRTEPQAADRPGAADLAAAIARRQGRGRIEFDHVTFRYKNQPQPIYDDFSLTIQPGERVALVGPTGAGKSTFVKLIQRLYDLETGRILIDGIDVAGVTQASLRRAIAVVPQDPALFHRTIAENIAYAQPDASMDEVIEAARRALAHDFIKRLPKGYDTLVGERGVKLSGGERQRVAIARAFLADAPILILDEATSSLDVETERQVAQAGEALMTGRTTIVIAHRLSTIRGADRILVFQNGRIVEEGRHADLVRQGGAYARLSALAGV
jgi:ATP-binding cassette subfamily B protein